MRKLRKRWSGLDSGRWEVVGGLQALLGAPMAAYSGCGEGDGGIGHGKRRSGPDWRELAGTLGQWRTGAVRLGVEWLAAGPGRD